jgi:hypothetical protein
MPKVQRNNIPRELFAHLLLRIEQRRISADALESLATWLDTNPEVPEGDWFKRFPTMTVCGSGVLVKTFLTPSHAAVGKGLLGVRSHFLTLFTSCPPIDAKTRREELDRPLAVSFSADSERGQLNSTSSSMPPIRSQALANSPITRACFSFRCCRSDLV